MPRAELDKRPGDVAAMFDAIAGRYDLLNDLLSLGQVRLWRRAVARITGARPGERVLDLAAGTGTSSLTFTATSNTSIRPLTRLASYSMRVTLYWIDAVESHSLPNSAIDPGDASEASGEDGACGAPRGDATRGAAGFGPGPLRRGCRALWHLGGQPAEQVTRRRGQSRWGRCHSWPRTCWARKAKTVSYQIWA